MTDGEFVLELMVKLFREVDTPDLREICGEDEWIRHQRHIYHRVKKGLDCEIPLRSLLTNAVEDVVASEQAAGRLTPR